MDKRFLQNVLSIIRKLKSNVEIVSISDKYWMYIEDKEKEVFYLAPFDAYYNNDEALKGIEYFQDIDNIEHVGTISWIDIEDLYQENRTLAASDGVMALFHEKGIEFIHESVDSSVLKNITYIENEDVPDLDKVVGSVLYHYSKQHNILLDEVKFLSTNLRQSVFDSLSNHNVIVDKDEMVIIHADLWASRYIKLISDEELDAMFLADNKLTASLTVDKLKELISIFGTNKTTNGNIGIYKTIEDIYMYYENKGVITFVLLEEYQEAFTGMYEFFENIKENINLDGIQINNSEFKRVSTRFDAIGNTKEGNLFGFKPNSSIMCGSMIDGSSNKDYEYKCINYENKSIVDEDLSNPNIVFLPSAIFNTMITKAEDDVHIEVVLYEGVEYIIMRSGNMVSVSIRSEFIEKE